MRGALAIVVVVVLAVPALRDARGEPAVPPLARQLADEGRALHDLGNYSGAIVDYEQAYVISPSPAILFNLAQAYRLAGDCANAAMLYRRFLERSDDLGAVRVARHQLAAVAPCAARAEQEAQAHRDALPVVTATAPAPPPRSRAEARTGLVVAGAGAIAVGVGAYFAIDAHEAADQVSAAYTSGTAWKDVAADDARGRQSSELATGLFIGGGAAVAAGAVLYVLGHRPSERGPRLTTSHVPGGAAVGVSWHF